MLGRACLVALVVISLFLVLLPSDTSGCECGPQPDPEVLEGFDNLEDQTISISGDELKEGQRISLLMRLRAAERTYRKCRPCEAATLLCVYLKKTKFLFEKRDVAIAENLHLSGELLYHLLLTKLPSHEYCKRHKPEALFKYAVDPSVQPIPNTIQSLDGVTPRSVAAVRAPDGQTTNFVANEIIVLDNDSSVLDRLIELYDGEIVLQIDPSTIGITTMPQMYVVRLNVSSVDLGGFAEDFDFLIRNTGAVPNGKWLISSEEGARLLALAASEVRKGAGVGVNVVVDLVSIPDSTEESSWCIHGGGYTPNAYEWRNFMRGNPLDIGVADAWSLLHLSERISNKVKIGIVDQGFWPNDDLPQGQVLSVHPVVIDPYHVRDYSGGWHGTHTASTAMAIPDNGLGAAGTAGPVGDPVLVYSGRVMADVAAGMIAARAAGAQIINASMSADMHWALALLNTYLDVATSNLAASGALLFAAAGNDGANVNETECNPLFPDHCWEKTWRWPCESSGVICVGGVQEWASSWVIKHPESAWGESKPYWEDGVDIYAPYSVFVGIDYDTVDVGHPAQIQEGTSMSSPFAAGVAALIWAGNPALRSDEVWDLMKSTAHGEGSLLWVNAYDAVFQSGLGHEVKITRPDDESVLEKGHPVTFCAEITTFLAAGAELPLRISWESNRDGLLHGEEVTLIGYVDAPENHNLCTSIASLSEGQHTITVTAETANETETDRINITYRNSPPSVRILQPRSGLHFCQGQPINFRASGEDPNESLPSDAFDWYSTLNGFLGEGLNWTYTDNLIAGEHRITLRATDSDGLFAEATTSIEVIHSSDMRCGDSAPEVQILSPESYATSGYCYPTDSSFSAAVASIGEVRDDNDSQSQLTIEWVSDLQGLLGTGTAVTVQLESFQPCLPVIHTITLRATDTANNVGEDTIQVCVAPPGC